MRARKITAAMCFVAGLLLVVTASADSGMQDGAIGWREVALGLTGLVVTLIGAYVAGQTGRITQLEILRNEDSARIVALREQVFREYHPRAEIEQMLEPLEHQLNEIMRAHHETALKVAAIHGRLDNMLGERRNRQ